MATVSCVHTHVPESPRGLSQGMAPGVGAVRRAAHASFTRELGGEGHWHCGQCMRAKFASLGPRVIVYALRTALEVRGSNYQSLWLYTESASSWSRLRNLGTKFFSMSPDDPGAATSSTCITS